MQIDQRELCQMFSETSFIAARYGMSEYSDVLASEIERTYPGTESPCINKGYALLCSGKTEESYAVFSKFFEARAAQNVQPSDLFLVFFALSMLECGFKTRAAKLFEEIIARNQDKDAVEMAKGLMSFATENKPRNP